jgi:hypothetical protein
MAAPVIQFKRGLLANLPGLQAGEPGFTTDSYDLYVGLTSSTATNKIIGSHRFWTNNTATTGSGVNLVEGTNNGTHFVTIKSPDSLAGIVTYTMPGTDGTNGQALVTNGSGTLSFATVTTSAGTLTGAGAGVTSFLTTPSSANLAAAVTDETGTGALVFANTPTLVTPVLGTPTSGTLTNCTGLPVSTGISGLGANVATFLGTPSSANLASAVSDETGTGALVFANTPTLVTPVLGTPTSGTLTNCTGLPISSGVSGLGAGVATFLATPSSANLASAVSDETGTGALVFANSPTLVTPSLGAASATSLQTTGNVTVGGDLIVNGSTTQVNTTSLTVEDSLIELGLVNASAPSSDLNIDLGLIFNYYTSSAKKAAVFWDDSASRIVFADDVSESTGVLTVASNAYASIEIEGLWVNDCAGQSQVISCSGSTRKLENITIDGGTF